MTSQPEHMPYAAKIARALLLIDTLGVATHVEDQLRSPNTQGRRRTATPASGMLALCASALQIHHNTRGAQLVELVQDVLASDVVRLFGLVRVDEHPATKHDLAFFFRRFHERHSSDLLRPIGAQLSDEERAQRSEAFAALIQAIVADWIPQDVPTGDMIIFDTTGHEGYARPLPKKLREQLLAEGSKDLLTNAERDLPFRDSGAAPSTALPPRRRDALGARNTHLRPAEGKHWRLARPHDSQRQQRHR